MNSYLAIFFFILQFKNTENIGEYLCSTNSDLDYSTPPNYYNNRMDVLQIEKICPHLVVSGGFAPVELCCDIYDINSIDFDLNIKFLMPDYCKNCRLNIERLLCDVFCYPNNSKYFEVSNIKVGRNEWKRHVLIDSDWAKTIFHSCSNNIFLPLKEKVLYFFGVSKELNKNDQINNFIKSILGLLYRKGISFELVSGYTTYSNGKEVVKNKDINCFSTYDFFNSTIDACSCRDCKEMCELNQNKLSTLYYGVIDREMLICIVMLSILLIIVILLICSSSFCWINKISESAKNSTNLNYSSTSGGISSKTELVGISFTTAYSSLYTVHLKIFNYLRVQFYSCGKFVLGHYILFMIFPILVATVLCCGLMYRPNIVLEQDGLFIKKNSQFKENELYFQENYKNIKKNCQIIFKLNNASSVPYITKNRNINISNILERNNLNQIFKLLDKIKKLNSKIFFNNTSYSTSLDDICFKPFVENPSHCLIASIFHYLHGWETIVENEEDYYGKILFCIENYHNTQNSNENEDEYPGCYDDLKIPLSPNYLFGRNYENNIMESHSIFISFLLNSVNGQDELTVQRTKGWELEFNKLLSSYKMENVSIFYYSDSLKQEEEKNSSETSIISIILPYIMIFIYMILFPGNFLFFYKNSKVFMMICINIVGVLPAIFSVVGGIGLFSYLGKPIPAITLELATFFVIISSFGNILLINNSLINEMEMRDKFKESLFFVMSNLFEIVGPQILYKTFLQIVSLQLGLFFYLPSIDFLCIITSVSLVLNAFFQVTFYLSFYYFLLSRFMADNFIRKEYSINEPGPNASSAFPINRLCLYYQKLLDQILSHNKLKLFTIFIFLTTFFISIYWSVHLPIGFELYDVLPPNSDLLKFIRTSYEESRMSSELYFLISDNFDYSEKKSYRKLCSSADCDHNSIISQLHYIIGSSNHSYITGYPSFWVESYLGWLSHHSLFSCCKYVVEIIINETYSVYPDQYIPCDSDEDDENVVCYSCINSEEIGVFDYLNKDNFNKHLHHFFHYIPNEGCPYGGLEYNETLVLNKFLNSSNYQEITGPVVQTSSITLFHKPLFYFDEFFNSMLNSMAIAANMSSEMGHKILAYSEIYGKFEIFILFKEKLFLILIITIIALALLTFFIYLFNWATALIVTLNITFIMAIELGLMSLIGVPLNPITSCVLIIVFGINLEYTYTMANGFSWNLSVKTKENVKELSGNYIFIILKGVTALIFIRVTFGLIECNQIIFKYFLKLYSIALFVSITTTSILTPLLFDLFFISREYSRKVISFRPESEYRDI